MKNILKIFENKEKRIENLVFLLVLLIITLIFINQILKSEEESVSLEVEEVIPTENLEVRLEDILSNIKGVKKAKVLITYSETEEIVPIYNLNNNSKETEEKGTKVIEESTIKNIVLDSSSNIIIEKKINPKIEGAIITASGAGKAEVKNNIILAVQAVTGLASHKIQVFEMGENYE